MKNLIDELERFTPLSEREKITKKMFLDYARNTPNSLDRENLVGHFTVSAWVINKEKTHVLCEHHNQFDAWSWLGGHCDGDGNLVRVAKKEIEEESGISNVELYQDSIFTLESERVLEHIKKGNFIPTHLHLNIIYVFVADDKDEIRIQEDENSAVEWKTFEEFIRIAPTELYRNLYQRIADRINEIEKQRKET